MAEREPPQQLMELYKLTVEMADRTSARRGLANSFFLALNSALATFLSASVASPGSARGLDQHGFGAFLTAAIGIVLCLAWWILLRSFRQLNAAKFKVILEMERQFITAPFGREWELLKADPVKRRFSRYAELGIVERVVPVLFMAAYVALAQQAIA